VSLRATHALLDSAKSANCIMAAMRASLLFVALFTVAMTLPTIACDSSETPITTVACPSPGGLPTTVIYDDDGETIIAEVASAPEERELGLGERDSLGGNCGMLFDLGETRIPTFWMKDTRIPLDMVWIAEDGTVAGVTADVPPEPGVADTQLRGYSPDGAVRYVLELNAGEAARRGIAPGTVLEWDAP
jgi:uncharacterized membrane protein (UPF0127 family)